METEEQFNHIEQKKPFFKVKKPLKEHLLHYSRMASLPVSYTDLMRFEHAIPKLDINGKDTLWKSVLYAPSDSENIYSGLEKVYQLLCADDEALLYIRIESVDFCSYGNSKPFRIKVVNEINDNHDYFYVKQADASRVYGLEIEDIVSPDKISYLFDEQTDTLFEEHIIGVSFDEFLERNKDKPIENRIRLAKEFVKFNERCFIRLLGDMRAYNFVVEIQQDFDNIQYRLRAMDFDQQSFEGRKNIYLPQFYKDNVSLVNLVQEVLSLDNISEYQRQERAAMKKRFLNSRQRAKSILRRMKIDTISLPEHVNNCRKK